MAELQPNRYGAFLKLAEYVWAEVMSRRSNIDEGLDMLRGVLEAGLFATDTTRTIHESGELDASHETQEVDNDVAKK